MWSLDGDKPLPRVTVAVKVKADSIYVLFFETVAVKSKGLALKLSESLLFPIFLFWSSIV